MREESGDQTGMIGGPEPVRRTGHVVGGHLAHQPDPPLHPPVVPDQYIVDTLIKVFYLIREIRQVAAGIPDLGATQRRNNAALHAVAEQLRHLQHATTLLQSTPHSASQSFYVHYAQQASPHLLLADLKGQLDLLAIQIGQKSSS